MDSARKRQTLDNGRALPIARDDSVSANESHETQSLHGDRWGNREYFGSYSHISIHEDMIRDSVRTGAYRRAILQNAADFKGKVVADVGCGTGILSLFCIEAGASKVYAIDASDMADYAKKVAKENDLEEKLIVIKGRVEDVELPEKVDVIVSEWMGYFLIYESMLDSVIIARDKWLKEDGVMYPAKASIYIAPFCDEEKYDSRVTFWDTLYGWKFTPLMEYAKECAFKEPQVDVLPGQCIIGPETRVFHIDCHTVTKDQLQSFEAPFTSKLFYSGPMFGMSVWFDVDFCSRHERDAPVVKLTTSPFTEPTHWCQTMLWILPPIPMEQDSIVSGTLKVSRNEGFKRGLDITLEYSTNHTETRSKAFQFL